MPSCTTTPEKSPLSQTALNLLDELQKADRIIHVMLNAMTPAQKLKVHAQLDNEGVSGGGMIRHHERLVDIAVLAVKGDTFQSIVVPVVELALKVSTSDFMVEQHGLDA